jgi:hypothetical protein
LDLEVVAVVERADARLRRGARAVATGKDPSVAAPRCYFD